MRIHQLHYAAQNGSRLTCGVNGVVRNEQPIINLFSLAETKNASLRDHIWGVAAQAARILFDGEYERSAVRYTLTGGAYTTDVRFQDQNGQPFQLEVSDTTVLTAKRQTDWTLQDYRRSYSDITGVAVNRERPENHTATSDTVFAIACNLVPDGVIYAKPNFYGTMLQDRCTYVMADPRKMWKHLIHHDPAMTRHATRQHNRLDVIDWVKDFASPLQPCDTGDYEAALDKDTGKTVLHMTRGHAGLLRAAVELHWPFLPIQLHTETGTDRTIQQHLNNNIKDLLSYRTERPLQPLIANSLMAAGPTVR